MRPHWTFGGGAFFATPLEGWAASQDKAKKVHVQTVLLGRECVAAHRRCGVLTGGQSCGATRHLDATWEREGSSDGEGEAVCHGEGPAESPAASEGPASRAVLDPGAAERRRAYGQQLVWISDDEDDAIVSAQKTAGAGSDDRTANCIAVGAPFEKKLARRNTIWSMCVEGVPSKAAKAARGKVLARKRLVKREVVLNFISMTIFQRFGGTNHDATVLMSAENNSEHFDKWRRGSPAPTDLIFLIQVHTQNNQTTQHLALCRPFNSVSNADGSVMTNARRRWHKAMAVVRSRIALMRLLREQQPSVFGGAASSTQEEDAGGKPSSGAKSDHEDGWFRMMVFKRTNPSGVRDLRDIVVL